MSTTVALQPSDAPERIIHVPLAVANMSVTIKNMLEDFGGSSDAPIPLHNVSHAMLVKVLEYCEQHIADAPAAADAPVPVIKPAKEEPLSAWDRAYCDVDQATLFEVILAANYLDIKPLLDVTCKTVANMIKGKTPEEIRKTFNIKNDFTPEEEENVRKENEWCEER